MTIINPIAITVDLENYFRDKRGAARVTQNTDVIFDITVLKAGNLIELSEDYVYLLTTQNQLKKSYSSPEPGVLIGENVIRFKLGSQQVETMGDVSASVQIMNGTERTDTMPFQFNVIADMTQGALESEQDKSIVQKLFYDVPTFVEGAKELMLEFKSKLDILTARLLEDWTGPKGDKGDKGDQGVPGDVTQAVADVNQVKESLASQQTTFIQETDVKVNNAVQTSTDAKKVVTDFVDQQGVYLEEGYARFWVGTLAEYDALTTKNEDTFYHIKG